MLLANEYYYAKAVPATNGGTMWIVLHHYADGGEVEWPETFWKAKDAQKLVDDLNIDLFDGSDE